MQDLKSHSVWFYTVNSQYKKKPFPENDCMKNNIIINLNTRIIVRIMVDIGESTFFTRLEIAAFFCFVRRILYDIINHHILK